ncbi:MAG: anaerobic glycerol-3-phosphate dehydrogenase subunit GlpB [Candidatus Dormibacteria bacterium]
MSHDVVVVGAGLAGLVAGIRLAQAGRDVAVFATGYGGLPLAPGVVDVLGYVEGPVTAPARELPGFLAAHPDHPLARIDSGALAAACRWFLGLVAPLGYQGTMERNLFLPTAVGALRPTALVPETMAAGDLTQGGSVLIVGIQGCRDFYPQLLAANLAAAPSPSGSRIEARAVQVALPGNVGSLRPQLLARRLEQPQVRAELAGLIRSELAHEERVGVPPVLGLENAREVWRDLQAAVGRPLFEIPTIPPSVPGIRLQALLTRSLRRVGGRLVTGASVVGGDGIGGRLASVRVASAAREVEVRADHFVLATGGVATGGIVVERGGGAREVVLGLPTTAVDLQPDPLSEYFSPRAGDRLGLAVDRLLRPVDRQGQPVYANLHAAGAIVGGAVPWREKSGNGISLATGYAAATAILGELN